MAGLSATSGGGFDYIQSSQPADPEKGELWFDTDGGTDGNGEAKVYDGNEWDPTGYVSHDQLTSVSPGDHFSPGSGLTFNSGTLALLLSSYLTIDGNGDLALASGSVGQDRLAFDTATQNELDGHEGDTSNPHSVDHSQLSGVGASDHHSRYSDGEAQSAAGGKLEENTATIADYGEKRLDIPVSPSETKHFQVFTQERGTTNFDLYHFWWDVDHWQYDTTKQTGDISAFIDSGDLVISNGTGSTVDAYYKIWTAK